MSHWEDIAARVEAGERLSAEEALTLWQQAPLWHIRKISVSLHRNQAMGH